MIYEGLNNLSKQIQQYLRDDNNIHMLDNVIATNLAFNKNYDMCEEAEKNFTQTRRKKLTEINQEI